MNESNYEKKIVDFSQGKAAVITIKPALEIEELVTLLSLPQYKAMVTMIGGADGLDETLALKLASLISRGIVPAITNAGAVIIDGGTRSGVMQLMGESLAGRRTSTPLIGVAPAVKVSYPGSPNEGTPLEPHHTHFVLTSGSEWGDETPVLFGLVAALLDPITFDQPAKKWHFKKAKPANKINGLVILIGGGKVSRQELLAAVRLKLSIIVVADTGGLADEVTAALNDRAQQIDEPGMSEIIADGELHIYHLSDPVKGMERLVIRELGFDNVLMQAWELFADYDANANAQQRRHNLLQVLILTLGILAAWLAIWYNSFPAKINASEKALQQTKELIHSILLIVPILSTVLLLAANKFKSGMKWLFLRAGAESLKREIYSYRTRSGEYAQRAEQVLARRMEIISRRTMRTDANQSTLKTYDRSKGFPPYMYGAKDGDDGFTLLNADRYIHFRLRDQLRFYRKSTRKIGWKIRGLYWATFLIGGIATYLSATGHQLWLAVTTAVATAITSYLGFTQLETSMVKYNQGYTDLMNVAAWWDALAPNEQADPENFALLVQHTEQVIKSEFEGWMQQMENSLAELEKVQEKNAMKKDNQSDKVNDQAKETSSTVKAKAKKVIKQA